MIDDIKKELSSLKLLISLGILAVSIYLLQYVFDLIRNFSDILLIIFFGWLISFILEPFVDFFTDKLKLPRIISTVLVFLLFAILIIISFAIFIPDILIQLKTLQKLVPTFMNNSPLPLQKGVDSFIKSLNNYGNIVPGVTQFAVNFVTILILSFYLIVDKDNINRKIFALTPRKYHDQIKFVQRITDQSFASFVRIQILWGLVGGLITWVVLTIFGVSFAASTSLTSGFLTAIPVVGPLIGVIPPLLVSLIERPDQAIIIFLIIFVTQQIIFNAMGPKIIGKAFNINPIIVILSLLIGIKIAGATGAIFAIPVVSIVLIVGREYYNFYFKEREG